MLAAAEDQDVSVQQETLLVVLETLELLVLDLTQEVETLQPLVVVVVLEDLETVSNHQNT
jgi:hypothetical protein